MGHLRSCYGEEFIDPGEILDPGLADKQVFGRPISGTARLLDSYSSNVLNPVRIDCVAYRLRLGCLEEPISACSGGDEWRNLKRDSGLALFVACGRLTDFEKHNIVSPDLFLSEIKNRKEGWDNSVPRCSKLPLVIG